MIVTGNSGEMRSSSEDDDPYIVVVRTGIQTLVTRREHCADTTSTHHAMRGHIFGTSLHHTYACTYVCNSLVLLQELAAVVPRNMNVQ